MSGRRRCTLALFGTLAVLRAAAQSFPAAAAAVQQSYAQAINTVYAETPTRRRGQSRRIAAHGVVQAVDGSRDGPLSAIDLSPAWPQLRAQPLPAALLNPAASVTSTPLFQQPLAPLATATTPAIVYRQRLIPTPLPPQPPPPLPPPPPLQPTIADAAASAPIAATPAPYFAATSAPYFAATSAPYFAATAPTIAATSAHPFASGPYTPPNLPPLREPPVENYWFADNTPMYYCAYGLPVPRYNTPRKRCIPWHPMCGIMWTCIYDTNSDDP